MKNYILMLCCVCFIVACSNDDTETVIPSDVMNITSEQKEGAILLKWDIPVDSNFLYIKVQYYDHWTKQDKTILRSVYSDSLLVENLLQRFGDYTFMLQTVSESGDTGKMQTIKNSCLRRPPKYELESKTEIGLTADMLSTGSPQANGSSLENLIDGDPKTHFHSSWKDKIVFPVYIQVNMDEPVNAFAFQYKNSTNSNGKPSIIEIYGSENGADFELVSTIKSGLPTTAGAEYTSLDYITAPKYYKSFQLKVTATAAGDRFINMAELKWYKYVLKVDDPEN